MTSFLSWIDHDTKARESTLRILSLFKERESRDELGLGGIRDSFSDQLFPGTSTIQTRLRYMFFIPWIYKSLEDNRIPAKNFADEADKAERKLITPLLKSDDNFGMFGRTAGDSLKRLPSSVYWAGLRRWGIHLSSFSQDEYHSRIDEYYNKRSAFKVHRDAMRSLGDDFDDTQGELSTWNSSLPVPPKDFPNIVDFRITKAEAEFICDCIHNKFPDSLLSFLALHCEPIESPFPWEHAKYTSFSEKHKELLTHARIFSEVMNGAAWVYNLSLAKLQKQDERIEEYEKNFKEWSESLILNEVNAWSLNRFWDLTLNKGHAITYHTREFVESWVWYCNAPH